MRHQRPTVLTPDHLELGFIIEPVNHQSRALPSLFTLRSPFMVKIYFIDANLVILSKSIKKPRKRGARRHTGSETGSARERGEPDCRDRPADD
jgi:hypothetical protein